MTPLTIEKHKVEQFEKTGGQCVLFNLRKATRVMTQIYDEALRPLGLRSTQLTLIGAAMTLQPATVNQIAETVVMDRTTLTRNLKPLEKQGLLKVGVGDDRRERVVLVTSKGRKLMDKAYPAIKKLGERMHQVIGPDCVGRLLNELGQVLVAVKTEK